MRPPLRPRLFAGLILGALLCASPAHGGSQLTEAALKVARGLRGDFMGVDSGGDLWVWDWPSGRCEVYGPSGERLASTRLEGAIAVDADRTWGVVGVMLGGLELRFVPWSGGPGTSLPLRDRAGNVAWIGPDRVAVAPAAAAHRVEIWDIKARRLVRTMGTATPLTPGPGLTILHTIALDYLPATQLLYTVDGFSGEIEVFTLDGRLVRQQAGPQVQRPEIDDWIRRVDREAREKNEVQDPLMWWFRPAVDEEGMIWLVQSCDREHGKVTLLGSRLNGSTTTLAFDEPCCSRSLVLWQGWALMYEKSAATPGCTGSFTCACSPIQCTRQCSPC